MRLVLLAAVGLVACSRAAPSIDPARSAVGSTSPVPAQGTCLVSQQRPYFAYQVDQPARWIVDSAALPPGRWRPTETAERGDTVTVQFVLDTLGRPELGTLRVLRASSPARASDALASVPAWRYTPARHGGCTVRQLVQTDARAR